MSNKGLNELYNYQNSKDRLFYFIKSKLSKYTSKRNYDFGNLETNYTSGLSPSLSKRIITEQEIIAEISKHFNYKDIEKYIDEICWRTYWKGFLEHYPEIWYDYLKDIIDLENFNSSKYQNALNGETDIDFFNTWVNELKVNGYLHNHTRMWFASIWIFQLGLPWQLGAHFFIKNLLDADPASNTLSWRWVAGLHTKGKCYKATLHNIFKFTNNRFTTSYIFKSTSGPIIEESTYSEKNIKFPELETESKINDNHGIIFHEEDLSYYKVKESDFILIQKSHFNPYGQSKTIEDFTNRSLESYSKRLSELHNCNITYFDWNHLETIKVWKEKYALNSISISYPCIGKLVKPITDAQKYIGSEFEYYMHKWDRLFWPHSNRGFFKLKKHIKKNLKILL